MELGRPRIAMAYDWPDWKPTVRTAVKVDPAVLAQYVGSSSGIVDIQRHGLIM